MAVPRRGPTIIDPSTLIQNRPTCPSLWYQDQRGIQALPCQDIQIDAQFHVSTAMVHLGSTWYNTSGRTIDVLFSLPLKGTVTAARTQIGEQRFMETAVISKNDMDDMKVKDTSSKSTIPKTSPYEEYIPDLFRLPIMSIKSGERIIIEIDFMEPLDFIQSRYVFTLPLIFPPGILPPDRPVHEIVRIHAVVNTVVPNVQVFSSSHPLQITQYDQPSRLDVVAGSPYGNVCIDFNLSYCLLSPSIIGTLIKESIMYTPDGKEHGSFACFVTPPTMDQIHQFFARSTVFILDRSGSMSGAPFREAVKALRIALDTMRVGDKFNVVMFDHEMITFRYDLQPCTPECIALCMEWVEHHQPTGGATEIMDPLKWSLQHLSQQASLDPSRISMPFIFLLTDGAVADERQICHYAKAACGPVRIMTFGIGSVCNWFFLKMLAELGRGFHSTALYQEHIVTRIQYLMNCCAVPVLTNITIAMDGVEACELYPFPIPDLFVGAPLMIAGKYTANGYFPPKVTLQGQASDGRVLALDIATTFNPYIPVNKVFLKQRIDLLTSRAWLENSAALEDEATRLSCEESLPCSYTSMVAYEITPAEHAKRQAQARAEAEAKEKWMQENNNKNIYQETLKKHQQQDADIKRKHQIKTAATVAAVAVGGVIVLGAVAYAAGDIGASLSNLPSLGLDTGLGDLFSGHGCGCCGCIDMLHSIGCGCCGDALSFVGDTCGDVCGAIGGACGEVCGFCGGICGNVIQGCGSVCGDAVNGITSCCGSCGGEVLSCIGSVGGEFCNCFCQVLGGLCSALGSCDLGGC